MKITVDDKTIDLGEAVGEIAKDTATRISYAIEAKAKEKCPAKTGMLRRSITTSVEEDGDTIRGTVGSNVEYAPYIHEGTGIFSRTGLGRTEVPWVYYDNASGGFVTTSGTPPTPFLSDALDEVAANIGDYLS